VAGSCGDGGGGVAVALRVPSDLERVNTGGGSVRPVSGRSVPGGIRMVRGFEDRVVKDEEEGIVEDDDDNVVGSDCDRTSNPGAWRDVLVDAR